MSLLAEEVVEEWLRRDGYFTIRKLKAGRFEIDLLAIRPEKDRSLTCRHLEVQVSFRPISYICKLTKRLQKASGHGANSPRKRSPEEWPECADEWVQKKFLGAGKEAIRQTLAATNWSLELVVHEVHFEEELRYIELAASRRDYKIKIVRFRDVVSSLGTKTKGRYVTAGADFVELLLLASENGSARR